MKKFILTFLSAVFLFAQHGTTNDPDLKLYLKGKYKKSFEGFEKRCKKNDSYACGMVGYMYNKGIGTKKDLNKAVSFYKKGCKLNDADSCTLLAYYYYKGNIVKQDTNKAVLLLKKACKLGNKSACNYLKQFK